MSESKVAMHENVMFTSAMTGSLITPEPHPSLPVKPAEIAEAALDAAKSCATAAHTQVRDPGMRPHLALIDPGRD